MFISETGQLFGCGHNAYKEVDCLPLPCHYANSSKIDKISIVFPLPIIVKSTGGTFQEAVSAMQTTELDVGEKVTKVVCGDHHTVVISASGSMYAWGMGYSFAASDETVPTGRGAKLTSSSASDGFQLPDPSVVSALSGYNKKIICADFLGKKSSEFLKI